MQTLNFTSDTPERLDKWLSEQLGTTRNQVEHAIKEGLVSINNVTAAKGGIKLTSGQKITITVPELQPQEKPEVNFDVEILYEDESILIINKPPFVTIHDAPSVKEPTLVDWLKVKNISLSTLSGEERHGIVHRLDKETTGVMAVAKTNAAHLSLASQLENRTMGRYYLALIDLPLKSHQIVERPLGRNPHNRLKMAVIPQGRQAKSAFFKLLLSRDEKQEFIAAKLFTGRTHQIRVHLASLQRHILGDTLYGYKSTKNIIPRVFLHAYVLYLKHPDTQKTVYFSAPVPDDMRQYLENHFETENLDTIIQPDHLLDLAATAL